jgi:hypothetical protein
MVKWTDRPALNLWGEILAEDCNLRATAKEDDPKGRLIHPPLEYMNTCCGNDYGISAARVIRTGHR